MNMCPLLRTGVPMYSVQNFAEVDTRDLTFWDQGLAGLHMECVSNDDAQIAVRGWEKIFAARTKGWTWDYALWGRRLVFD